MSSKFPKYKYLITYRLNEIIFDLVDAFVLRYLSHLGNLSYLSLKEQILKCARSIKIFTLCHQLSFLLHRQIQAAENKFVQEGGFTENLFLKRINKLKLTKPHLLIQGFTLLEVIIVVALISLLIIAGFTLMNPKKQIEKAWDTKRKKDLDTIKKILEDYYNDKNCYPKAEEISYQVIAPGQGYICGNEESSPNFQPYISKLPCDPQNPMKKYLYINENSSCPSNFRVYAILSENIPFSGSNNYNYGISSGNISLRPYPTSSYSAPTSTSIPYPTNSTAPTIPFSTLTPCPPDPIQKYCYKGQICNICGSFFYCQQPISCNQPLQLYLNSLCTQPCSMP